MGLAAILLLDEVLQGSCRTYNAMIGRCDMKIFSRKYIIIIDIILITNKGFQAAISIGTIGHCNALVYLTWGIF